MHFLFLGKRFSLSRVAWRANLISLGRGLRVGRVGWVGMWVDSGSGVGRVRSEVGHLIFSEWLAKRMQSVNAFSRRHLTCIVF